MKNSKQELKDAIMTIGKHISEDSGKSYVTLMESSDISLPRMVEFVSHDLFVNHIEQYFVKDQDVFDAISMVRKYCIELKKNGSVEFNEEFDSDKYMASLNSNQKL